MTKITDSVDADQYLGRGNRRWCEHREGRPSTTSESMANALEFPLIHPLFQQIVTEPTDYDWWFHWSADIEPGIGQNGASVDKFNQYGSQYESIQLLRRKDVSSDDDCHVSGEPPIKVENIKFSEPGINSAKNSSSDYTLFHDNDTYSGFNSPWGGADHTYNFRATPEDCGAPDYYFIGTWGNDNEIFASLDSVTNPQTGLDANLYVDTRGGDEVVTTGDGCDVIKTGRASSPDMYTQIASFRGNDLVFGSMARDGIYLGFGDDRGYGGGGIDTINGGPGEDYLDGGGNLDVLIGGPHADTFAINLRGQADVIGDFIGIGDKIIFSDEQSSVVNAGDWFIQAGQSTDPSATQALGGNNAYDCFNIVSTITGDIAAYVVAPSSLQGSRLYLKATENTLEVVEEASATFSIQI